MTLESGRTVHTFSLVLSSLTIAVQPPNRQHRNYHWVYTYKNLPSFKTNGFVSVIEILYRYQKSPYKKYLATHHEQPSITKINKNCMIVIS